MKKIFEEVTLGKVKARNRILRSATHERGGADKGEITPVLKQVYGDLARGGVGTIITGMMGVGPNACMNGSMAKMYVESFPAKLKELVAEVHAAGAKIVVQIASCGVKSGEVDKGSNPLGPSDYTFIPDKPGKAMTKDDIKTLVADFAKAAQKCKDSGADAVQIHAAHGYLIDQFLSPFFNKRTDEYGGGLENRARLLFDVYAAVRAQVGPAYPVWVKINFDDLTEPGFKGEECLQICEQLAKKGIDIIEVSSGAGNDGKSSPSRRVKDGEPEGSFLDAALQVAAKTKMPVISVGGYRTPAGIETALNKGDIAGISLCRPFIAEPGLVKRWQGGDAGKAKCISCNKCFGAPKFGCPIRDTLQ